MVPPLSCLHSAFCHVDKEKKLIQQDELSVTHTTDANLTICYHMEELQRLYNPWEESVTKTHVLYDSTYVWHSEW